MDYTCKGEKNRTTLRELQDILNDKFVTDNRDLDKECYFMYVSEGSVCVVYDNNIIKYDSDYYSYDDCIFDNIIARFDAVYCRYRDKFYYDYDYVDAIVTYDTLTNIDISSIVVDYTADSSDITFNANDYDFMRFTIDLDFIDFKKFEEYGREDISAVVYKSVMNRIREFNAIINRIPDSAKVLAEL